MALCPEHPKRDQNPKFTPLSETTSIPVCFIYESPPGDDKHKRWRDEWVGELKKTREVDKDFRQKINEDKVYACEKHFKDEMIEICKYFLINRACSSVTINIAFEARASALCSTIRC